MTALHVLAALITRALGARQGVALDVAGLGALTVGGFTWSTPVGTVLLGLALLVLNAVHNGQPPAGAA